MRTLLLLSCALVFVGCIVAPTDRPEDEPSAEPQEQYGEPEEADGKLHDVAFPEGPLLGTDGAWTLTDCSAGDVRPRALPDLVVLLMTVDGAHVLRHVRIEDNEVRVLHASEHSLSSTSPTGPAIAVAPEGVFVLADGQLRRFDRELRLVASVDDDGVALALRDGRVFTVGAHMRSYDLDLALLDEVELPLKDGPYGKVAHDVLLHGTRAFLLDDIIFPLYVLRVDVEDAGNMSVIDRQQLVSQHLSHHWIDSADDEWNVISTSGGRMTSVAVLHALPIEIGPSHRDTNLYSGRWREDGSSTTEGLYISGLRRELGLPWVLAGAGFGPLDAKDGRVTFCSVPAPRASEERAAPMLVGSGDGFVIQAEGRALTIWDTASGRPALTGRAVLSGVVHAALPLV